MDDFFELIDLTSGNLVGDYDDANAALEALRVTSERYGRSAIENYSLMRIQGEMQTVIALQDDLVRLVESSVHPRVVTRT